MNVAQLLARTARVHPQRPALLSGAQSVSDYRGFAESAARIAGYLRHSLGLARGERVALVMTNCTQYLELLWGVWWAGLVAVPVNSKLHEREIAFILENSGAAVLAVTPDLVPRLLPEVAHLSCAKHVLVAGELSFSKAASVEAMPAPEDCKGDDLAWLFYTSGTTGRPKGVMLTHRNLLAMTMCYFTDVDHIGLQDATVYAAPMSHGAGLYCLAFVLAGARHVVPASGGFDAAELVELASEIKQVSLFAAPTIVKRIVDHIAASGGGAEGFKTIVYGGAPMYVEDIRRALEVMGDRFVQIFGQGESPMTITALSREHLAGRKHPRYLERIASVGVAHAMVEVRIAGADGQPLPAGETGEVLVRGDPVMAGYWNNRAASAAALRDGWLFTGDIGVLDGDGFLTLKDRSKDVIISGGSNIYPREVEEVLLMHPAVAEVSVVGRKDAEWGEAVVAFVVLEAGAQASAGELDALCLAHIARFKRPKDYRFIASLPKNNYGKVLKTQLRQALEAQEAGAEQA